MSDRLLVSADGNRFLATRQSARQLRRPPVYPCMPSLGRNADEMLGFIGGWFVPIGLVVGAAMGMLSLVGLGCLVVVAVLYPLLPARDAATQRARLQTKVGWLRLGLGEVATATDLLRTAHVELQSVVGKDDVDCSYVVAPALARALCEIERGEEAEELQRQVRAAANRNSRGWRRWKHFLCSCRGAGNCCVSSSGGVQLTSENSITERSLFEKTG